MEFPSEIFAKQKPINPIGSMMLLYMVTFTQHHGSYGNKSLMPKAWLAKPTFLGQIRMFAAFLSS